MNGGFYVLECCGHPFTSFALHRNCASFVFDDDMILEKAGRILGDWIKQTPRGSPGHAVNSVSVTHGYDIGVGLVHGSVQHETCSVKCVVAFSNLPLVIGQYQI